MNLLLVALTTLSAHAAVPQPAAGVPVCMVRQYTAEHLRRNPAQKLSSLFVKLETKTVTGDGNQTYSYNAATVVGQSNDVFYGNNLAGCEYKADGTVKCQVDCDGGSFNLVPRDMGVLFQVTKDYYFPLYKNGADPENAKPGDELQLNGNDKENNEYLTQPVDVEQCDRAIQAMRQADFGC